MKISTIEKSFQESLNFCVKAVLLQSANLGVLAVSDLHEGFPSSSISENRQYKILLQTLDRQERFCPHFSAKNVPTCLYFIVTVQWNNTLAAQKTLVSLVQSKRNATVEWFYVWQKLYCIQRAMIECNLMFVMSENTRLNNINVDIESYMKRVCVDWL